MRERVENPFRITKSNDLTDDQIDELWVTSSEEDGLAGLARPSSPMAMFILGGKGSGKSHLMRYYSFPVQLIRYAKANIKPLDGVSVDGYIGIYSRCGGLDSHRFDGKGQPAEKWNDLFAFYFELWVADKTLFVIETLLGSSDLDKTVDSAIATSVASLFDQSVQFDSVSKARAFLSDLRRTIDYTVNNASITNRLDAEILVSRGRLFFGIPSIATSHIKSLKNALFVYLLDEFENFTISQQTYINTLIREKEGPTAFKVGARLYGIRTKRTLSGGERNLQGSEYEELRLDERFRNNTKGYKTFALRLIARRLGSALGADTVEPEPTALKKYFEEPNFSWDSPFLAKLCDPSEPLARIHLQHFNRKLLKGIRESVIVGPRTDGDASLILKCVSFPEYPLIEKLCVLFLYQQWFRSANVLDAAHHVYERATAFINGHRNEKFDEFIAKHKEDMIAQLLRENNQKQIYAGLERFIRMSEGLPRALITILKHVYDWSSYTQERPFKGGQISIRRAQQRGVVEAAEWFFDQMLEEGEDGVLVRSGVERLSQLFRINRFADKPIETSLVAFSVDEVQLAEEARRALSLARNTSLIVDIPRGQRERNSEQVTSKLELNLMLAPLWDLPIARRGVATFSPPEANAIFLYQQRENFESLLKNWEAKMTAPYFGRARDATGSPATQTDLFE